MAKNYYHENSPFLVRKPLVRLWQMVLFGLFMTTAMFGAIYYGGPGVADFVIILFGVLIIILLYYINNTYFDEKTAGEFQSSVFSGAMRCNTYLTFILYQDASVYYLDQRYTTEVLNASNNHDLDNILGTLSIENADKDKIIKCTQYLEKHEFNHTFFDGQKRVHVLVKVTPLMRPRGFVSLTLEKTES
jgi:hypothetical protein